SVCLANGVGRTTAPAHDEAVARGTQRRVRTYKGIAAELQFRPNRICIGVEDLPAQHDVILFASGTGVVRAARSYAEADASKHFGHPGNDEITIRQRGDGRTPLVQWGTAIDLELIADFFACLGEALSEDSLHRVGNRSAVGIFLLTDARPGDDHRPVSQRS